MISTVFLFHTPHFPDWIVIVYTVAKHQTNTFLLAYGLALMFAAIFYS